jgi:hypothetical protein
MAFFQLLSEYKTVHARSWCYREKNPGGAEGPIRPFGEKYWNDYHVGPIRLDWPKGWENDEWGNPRWKKQSSNPKVNGGQTLFSFYDGNVRGVADYKFVITFENSKRPGYITEKIVNAKLAHSVPIYWGPPKEFLEANLNMKSFIHCDIPPSAYMAVEKPVGHIAKENGLDPTKRPHIDKYVAALKESIRGAAQPCIKRIKELDADDNLYSEMISESLIPHNNISGSMFDITVLGSKLRRFMQDKNEFQ